MEVSSTQKSTSTATPEMKESTTNKGVAKSRWNRQKATPEVSTKENMSMAPDSKAAPTTKAEKTGPSVDMPQLLKIGTVAEEAARAEAARASGGNKGWLARIAHETLQIL